LRGGSKADRIKGEKEEGSEMAKEGEVKKQGRCEIGSQWDLPP
jgi:hypothetical protein